MALVTTAAAAVVLRARNDQFEIYFRSDPTFERLKKTRPAGAAVELRLRGEQRLIAASTVIIPGSLLVIQRTGERALRPFIAKHVVRLGSKPLSPGIVAEIPGRVTGL